MLDSSKLKEFADDNSKFDENGRKFFNPIKNTVGKGEIARDEQFLLFHSVFRRLVLQTCKNQFLFGKGLRDKDIVGTGENARYKHFLLVPTMFWKIFSLKTVKSRK